MLHGAGDAQGDVQLRRDDFAGLADLQLVRRDARIDQCPRAAGRAAKASASWPTSCSKSSLLRNARPPETTTRASVTSGREFCFDLSPSYCPRQASVAASSSIRSIALAVGRALGRRICRCADRDDLRRTDQSQRRRHRPGKLRTVELQPPVDQFVAQRRRWPSHRPTGRRPAAARLSKRSTPPHRPGRISLADNRRNRPANGSASGCSKRGRIDHEHRCIPGRLRGHCLRLDGRAPATPPRRRSHRRPHSQRSGTTGSRRGALRPSCSATTRIRMAEICRRHLSNDGAPSSRRAARSTRRPNSPARSAASCPPSDSEALPRAARSARPILVGEHVERLLLGLHDAGQRRIPRLVEPQIGRHHRRQRQANRLDAVIGLAIDANLARRAVPIATQTWPAANRTAPRETGPSGSHRRRPPACPSAPSWAAPVRRPPAAAGHVPGIERARRTARGSPASRPSPAPSAAAARSRRRRCRRRRPPCRPPTRSPMRTASSSAIASNGLMTYGIDRRATELPSAAATIFWSVSGTRLVGTRIFMATSARRRPASGRSTLP